MAGIRTMPLTVGGSLFAVISGIIVAKTGDYRWIMLVGWVSFVIHGNDPFQNSNVRLL